jgi:6-pyruvoyltetrahydropterin/6-carboxytetrahydropterin synthase
MHVQLVKTFGFEAAHHLPSFPDGHKCRRLHGHSYSVDVVVEGRVPEGRSHLIDYADIKTAFEPIRKRLDHAYLNEIEGLEDPTAEVITAWIWDRLKPRLPLLAEIRLHETCNNACIYRGPDIPERAE